MTADPGWPLDRLARLLAVHDAPDWRAADEELAVIADPEGPARTGLSWGDLRALHALLAPRTHPAGVVIPPNPGDTNYVGVPEGEMGPPFGGCTEGSHARICDDGIWTCAIRRFNIPDAAQAPVSVPGTPPRGSSDGQDGSDALRAAMRDEIVGFAIGSGYYTSPIGTGEAHDLAAALLPLVLDYGRQQAAAALRDAAEHVPLALDASRPQAYIDGFYDALSAVTARADEIHGTTG